MACPFLPDAWSLRLDHVSVSAGEALIVASSARPTGTCPRCGRPASRVHSRYTRTLQDLSWQGTRVIIRWLSRKFFCDTAGCSTRIFTERLPQIAIPHGRRTLRARDVLECLGLSLGGEAGSRVAHLLQLPVNRTAWLLFLDRQELEPEERRLADALDAQCPTLLQAAKRAREFERLVKQRLADDLADWLQRACRDDAPVEIRNFALGLRAELPAIEATLRLSWSNGQAEGQINRLKLVKRQMYGRAKFDLLKLRFLLGQTAA